MTRDPTTVLEWQEAADLADAWLMVDAARQYGILVGGPPIDVARCHQILDKAMRRKILPDKDAALKLVRILNGQTTTEGAPRG